MNRFGLGLALAVMSMGALAGCSGDASGDEETSSEELTNKDSQGLDVQVLQIWTPGRVFPLKTFDNTTTIKANDIVLDANKPVKCPIGKTSSYNDWENREVDCTTALSEAAKLDVDGKIGPSMNPLRFTLSEQGNSGHVIPDPDFCNRVEVRLVVKDAALKAPRFAGVGFSTSRGDSFAKKSKLQKVGNVTLKNGEPATVLRFVGASTCVSSAHSSTSGNMYQTFSFKPYAAFDEAGTRHRVWEDVSGDHVIGRSWPGKQPTVNSEGFDRQDELLSK